MGTLTWLHLSDLHFREENAYDENVVLKALLRDIAERIQQDDLKPGFIVVTGDIAFGSRPEEYDMAQEFFDDLLDSIGLDKARIFLVPGNHDVDRGAISTLAAGATSILNDRNDVNRFLANEADRALVLQRFHHYRDFVNRYLGPHLTFDDEHYFYVKQIEAVGRRVAILGLNSAWLSASDEDRNRLMLGERQIRAALDAAQDADLRVAVMHHPFDWLQDFDRNDVEALLCRDCHFVLHGHMHQVGLLQARTPDTEAMIIAAGACYETRQYPNSYNFVQLDLTTGRGTVHLRMYSDRQGGFWTKDVLNYRNVPDGVYEFPLPDRLRHSSPGGRASSREQVVWVTPAAAEQSKTADLGSPLIPTHRSGLNLAALRRRLNQRFDDPEFDAFCLEHFPEVYDRFSRGMRKDEKIMLLLDHCRRDRNRYQRLLAALEG